MVKPINGDAVELHYGDVVVSLPEQLATQQQQIVDLVALHQRNYRLILVSLGLIALHTFVPTEQLLPFILRLIGL